MNRGETVFTTDVHMDASTTIDYNNCSVTNIPAALLAPAASEFLVFGFSFDEADPLIIPITDALDDPASPNAGEWKRIQGTNIGGTGMEQSAAPITKTTTLSSYVIDDPDRTDEYMLIGKTARYKLHINFLFFVTSGGPASTVHHPHIGLTVNSTSDLAVQVSSITSNKQDEEISLTPDAVLFLPVGAKVRFWTANDTANSTSIDFIRISFILEEVPGS